MSDIGVAIIKFTTFISVSLFVCVCVYTLQDEKIIYWQKIKFYKIGKRIKWNDMNVYNNVKGFVIEAARMCLYRLIFKWRPNLPFSRFPF